MANLNSNGVHYDFNVVDGIHVQNIVIQNSSSTGKIVDNDNWKSIVFYGIQCIDAGSSPSPDVVTGTPSYIRFSDLASDGTNNSINLITNNGDGSTKVVYIHKTGGEWRLRHASHGHNHTYLVIFSLAST